MIHVCRVDIGSRHVFDSADGINDVGSLIAAIEQHFKIDKSKQILLIGGGEVLDDHSQKLYRLSAGREESPIYLIDRVNVEKDQPPVIEKPLDNISQDMKAEIQAAIQYKPSFQTLQLRSQLTMKVNEIDKNLHKLCQSFYDDQFWQYQGYLALIANLDEYVSSFHKKEDLIREQFSKYFANQADYKDLSNQIDKYIEFLSHVRLLPQILSDQMHRSLEATGKLNQSPTQINKIRPTNALFSSFSSQSIANLQILSNISDTSHYKKSDSEMALSPISSPSTLNNYSLLDWIKSTDPQNKLHSVIEETKEMLNSFDNNSKWRDLQAKISKVFSQIENNSQMREIEGLTKRLHDLNNFLEESKKLLASQNEICESLSQNLGRATSLKDESILIDLCKGHERQLDVFRVNHNKMIEITNKISRAKLELIRVIHSRLHWVMQVQKQLYEYDFELQISFKQLTRLNVRIKLMDQLKKAPYFYLYSLKETIRRKNFTNTYKMFANSIKSLINTVYTREMNRRQNFDSKTFQASQSFVLNILFRSLNDKVEAFLTESELKFDNDLPKIEESEVLAIEEEIKKYISLNQQNTPINSSSSSSSSSSTTSANQLNFEASSPTQTSSTQLNDNKKTDGKVRKCFYESLLNEFNIQNQIELKKDSDLGILESVIDLIRKEQEEIEQSSNQIELESNKNNNNSNKMQLVKLDESLRQMVSTSLQDVKLKLKESKEIYYNHQAELNESIKKLVEIQKEQEKNNLAINERLNKDKDLKSIFYAKLNDLVETILQNSNCTEDELNELINKKIESMLDNDNDEHKELINKLVQLVKANQTANLKQIDELKLSLKTLKNNLNAEKQIQFNEAIKKATQDKDRLIEELRSKELGYLEEIRALKAALDAKSAVSKPISIESDVIDDSQKSQLINERLDAAKNLCEVNEAKSKLKEVMLKEKIEQLEKQLSLLSTLPVTNDYETIQLNSCNIDDLVIAIYSEEHNSYKILHKSSTYLHFVHSAIFKSHEQKLSFKNANESVVKASQLNSQYSTSPSDQTNFDIQFADMNASSAIPQTPSTPNLSKINDISNINSVTASSSMTADLNSSPFVKNSPSDNIDNIFLSEKQPQWFIGRVLVKEFCIARRENNRFRVPCGTRFYRVKLKPYNLN